MENLQSMRNTTCCFTGHRPEKLQQDEHKIKYLLKNEIMRAIDDGFTVFLSGMARGVDLWAAEIVLQLRDCGQPIRLISVSPYAGVEQHWSATWQNQYRTVLHAADQIIYTSPHYSKTCFQIRNEWMIDHSARVVAVYNGQPGGTRNTLRYAQKCGVEQRIISGGNIPSCPQNAVSPQYGPKEPYHPS